MPDSSNPPSLAEQALVWRTPAEMHAALVGTGILGPADRFLQFEFDITSKCNLRCRMCYFSVDDIFQAKPVYLTEDHLRMLEPWLSSTHTLTLSLGNEPLSSPHFPAVLRWLAPHGVPNVVFFTNGVLISATLSTQIVSAGVTLVCVSCDGATRETFEWIRRGATFDRWVAGVTRLVDARRISGGRTPRLRMNIVAQRGNVAELPALADLAAALEMQEVNVCHLVAYDGLGMEDERLSEHPHLWNAMRGPFLERCVALGLTVTAVPPLFGTPIADVADGGDLPRPYCLYPFFHVSMDAGGHVLACPFAHGEPAYGQVSPTANFGAVWMNETFGELRRRILAHDPPPMCQRCAYLANHYPNAPTRFATRPWRPGR